MDLTPESQQQKKQYYREWRQKNKDKVIAAQQRYWEKKAREAQTAHSTAPGNSAVTPVNIDI